MNQAKDNTEAREEAGTLPPWKPSPGSLPLRRSDLMVDLTGVEALDLTSLALLLTAQQNAQQEDRAVWLVGVPLPVWKTLQAMGLGRFFRPFPLSGTLSA